MGFALDFLLKLCPGGGFRVTDVPQSEGDALIWLYKHTSGPNWTNHTNWLQTHTVGNWFGVTVAGGHVTQLSLGTNNLIGTIDATPLNGLPSLTVLHLGGNFPGLVADFSAWVLPATLTVVYFHNSFTIGGNASGWVLPAPLTLMYLYNTAVSGNVSSWVLPAPLQELYIYSTGLSGTPDISVNTAMRRYYYQDCALTQANVNAILLSVYNRRMAFTFATPALNVGGTNLAPSGVYGAACPPGTGKEYAFELVNDSCGSGHIKWAVTFTP